MLTPISNSKRTRESPEVKENRLKSVRTTNMTSATQPEPTLSEEHSLLLTSIKEMFKTEIQDQIKEIFKADLKQQIQDAVKSAFSQELDKRLEEMVTKKEIKELEEKLANREVENDEIRGNLKELEDRLERFDRKDRCRNLIFTNVTYVQGAIMTGYQICNQNLKIDSQLINIKDAFVIKKQSNDKVTLLVEFAEKSMVGVVFRHLKNLHGSNIRVERDLSEANRKRRKILVDFKKHLLSVSRELRVNVRENTLTVGSNTFTLKDRDGKLEPLEEGVDTVAFFQDNYEINVVDYFNQVM